MDQRPPKLLSLRQVEDLSGYQQSWIYSAIKRGDFPAPVPLGRRCVRWVEGEVLKWIELRIANREAAVRDREQVLRKQLAAMRRGRRSAAAA